MKPKTVGHHVWLTRHECQPDMYDDDELGAEVYDFAYSAGYHNGPQCKNCGFHFCQHCRPGAKRSKCDGSPAIEGDDSKLFDPDMSQLLTIGAALGLIDTEAL